MQGLVAGVLMLAAGACSGQDAAPAANIVLPGDFNTSAIGVPNVAAGATVSIGGIIICLDKPGTARITSVDPDQQQGLIVTGFAVRISPFATGHDGLGGAATTLAGAHFDPSAHTLARQCVKNSASHTYELGIQLTRSQTISARTDGFSVRYVSGHRHGSLHVPFGVTMCLPTPGPGGPHPCMSS